MKSLLNKCGVNDILEAFNGKEAIEVYRSNMNSIRLILMDINMPVLDGMQACKCIRDLQEQYKMDMIPIIALTAQNDKQYIDMAMNMGFT